MVFIERDSHVWRTDREPVVLASSVGIYWLVPTYQDIHNYLPKEGGSMKMRRQLLSLFFCAVLTLSFVACGNEEPTEPAPDVAAIYNDYEVLWEHVEMSRKSYSFENEMNAESVGVPSDLEIVNTIIHGFIQKEEAMKRGLMPSETELDAFVNSVKEIYATPEGKEMMDTFLETAEMTIDEYIEILTDAAPAILAKQNLRKEIGMEYCQEHGLEYTNINAPQEMLDAIDAYIDGLFESHKDEIEYFFDVNE